MFVTGAAVQWLRDGLGIVAEAAETEGMAASLDSNDDVYFVPALTGLGSPHWDPYARGTIVGLTRGTTRAHLARAALEAIAYQTVDAVRAQERVAGETLPELRADGGAVANKWLMQFQADVLGAPVSVPAITETTALGAAYLAGIATGFWEHDEVAGLHGEAARYEPRMEADERERLLGRWQRGGRAGRRLGRRGAGRVTAAAAGVRNRERGRPTARPAHPMPPAELKPQRYKETRPAELFAPFHAWTRTHPPGWTYTLVRLVMTWIALPIYRTRAISTANVPADGPFILAPNHFSNMDHFFCGVLIRRKIGFMAKSQMFLRNRVLDYIYRVGGVFPVRRGHHDEEAFITAHSILARGGCVLIYAEGGRSRSGRARQGEAGSRAGWRSSPACRSSRSRSTAPRACARGRSSRSRRSRPVRRADHASSGSSTRAARLSRRPPTRSSTASRRCTRGSSARAARASSARSAAAAPPPPSGSSTPPPGAATRSERRASATARGRARR